MKPCVGVVMNGEEFKKRENCRRASLAQTAQKMPQRKAAIFSIHTYSIANACPALQSVEVGVKPMQLSHLPLCYTNFNGTFPYGVEPAAFWSVLTI
jgi:hypothetical protein